MTNDEAWEEFDAWSYLFDIKAELAFIVAEQMREGNHG